MPLSPTESTCRLRLKAGPAGSGRASGSAAPCTVARTRFSCVSPLKSLLGRLGTAMLCCLRLAARLGVEWQPGHHVQGVAPAVWCLAGWPPYHAQRPGLRALNGQPVASRLNPRPIGCFPSRRLGAFVMPIRPRRHGHCSYQPLRERGSLVGWLSFRLLFLAQRHRLLRCQAEWPAHGQDLPGAVFLGFALLCLFVLGSERK